MKALESMTFHLLKRSYYSGIRWAATGLESPMSEGASGSQKSAVLKPWEIAVKLLPSVNGQAVDVEHASDAEFQAWIETSGLSDLVDDDGIAEWSFDDRCRIINFALRKGRKLSFVEGENNSENSANNSGSELFGGDNPKSEAM